MRKIGKIIIPVIIIVVVVSLVTGGAFACTSSKTTWTNSDDDTIYTDVAQDIYAGYDWEYDETTPSVTYEANSDSPHVRETDTDGEDETDEQSDSGDVYYFGDAGDDSYSSDYGNGNYPYTGQIALNEAQENMEICLNWASLHIAYGYYYGTEDTELNDASALGMLTTHYAYNDYFVALCNESFGYENDLVFSEAFMCQFVSAFVPDYDGDLEASLSAFNKAYGWEPLTLENGVVDYHRAQGDLGEDDCANDFYITSWTDNADGTITVEAQRTYYLYYDEYRENFAPTLTYRFELVPNSYTAQMSDPIFEYSIESVEYLGNYFLLDSDTHYWAESEIEGMAKLIASHDATNYKKALRFMRNEIYARHGAIFQDSELQNYFESQPWYTPTVAVADFDDSDLNACEHANIEAILNLEAAE